MTGYRNDKQNISGLNLKHALITAALTVLVLALLFLLCHAEPSEAKSGKLKGVKGKIYQIKPLNAPEKVEIAKIKDGADYISIRWEKAKRAKKYQIYIRKVNGTWKRVASVKAPKLTYSYRKPNKARAYDIKVRAVNTRDIKNVCHQKKTGPFSYVETTSKVDPAVAVDANRMTVCWTKDAHFTEYAVYLRDVTSDTPYKKVGTTADVSFVIEKKFCTTYRVKVKGINSGLGSMSASVRVTTGSNPDLPYERIFTLPSIAVDVNYTATSVDGIAFVGNDLYLIKRAVAAKNKDVDTGYYPIMLGCVKNFAKYKSTQDAPVRYKVIHYKDGSTYYGLHGASLTKCGSTLMMSACGSPGGGAPIVELNKKGEVLGEFMPEGYANSAALGSVAYMGKDPDTGCELFISKDGKVKVTEGERHRFSVGILDREKNALKKVKTYITKNQENDIFDQKKELGKPHTNDIHYDIETGLLFHTIFVYDKDSTNITRNWIYVYDIGKSTEIEGAETDSAETDQLNDNTSEADGLSDDASGFDDTDDGKDPDEDEDGPDESGTDQDGMYLLEQINKREYNISTENSSETKFEIEGIDMVDGVVYVGVNTAGISDALYRIKDMTF